MKQQTQLSALIDATLSDLVSKKYSEGTIENHRRAYALLLQFCVDTEIETYGEEVGDLFLKSLQHREPKLSTGSINNYRLYLRRINSALSNSVWQPQYKGASLEYAKSRYSELVSKYETYLYKTGKTLRNVRARTHLVARFLQFVEDHDCINLSDLSVAHIYDAFKSATDKRAFRSIVGAFLRYAKTYGLVAVDLNALMPEIPNHVTVPTVYSPEEIEQLLASMNRSTPNAKRDYAMVLIAARLGLRACDIANMTLNCLRWENQSIDLVQSKTKQSLKLPLLKEVESALRDYIYNARSQATDTHVFLRNYGSGAISAGIVCGVVRKAFEGSGIDIGNRRHGSHSLRSSLATALLQEGNDYPTVQKVLGQRDIQSSKSYAKADVEQLRKIAISVPIPNSTFAELLKLPINPEAKHNNISLPAQKNEVYEGVAR